MDCRFIHIKSSILVTIISKSRSLFGYAIFLAYVVMFCLLPWVHHHPGADHPGVGGDLQHFHFSSDASCVCKDEALLQAFASSINTSLPKCHEDVKRASAKGHILLSGHSFLISPKYSSRNTSSPSKLTFQIEGWESTIRLFLSGYDALPKDLRAYPPPEDLIFICADLPPPAA